MVPSGDVVPPHDHAQHFKGRAQLLSLQHARQCRQAALAEQHLAQVALAVARGRMVEAHVQLDEEQSGEVEGVVGPEVTVVDDPYAACVVADIDGEPDLFDDEAGPFGHKVALGAQAQDYFVHNSLPVKDHTQPAQAGHVTDLIGMVFVGARGWIAHA